LENNAFVIVHIIIGANGVSYDLPRKIEKNLPSFSSKIEGDSGRRAGNRLLRLKDSSPDVSLMLNSLYKVNKQKDNILQKNV